ncbi:MAG: DUF1844 domain-containing protein [Candidatus Omnitrophica bacterium]|nr:DUF1844 domain-containing protein [Candidatus Omnitrophota bacterium]
MSEEIKKKVDQEWKDQVVKEQQEAQTKDETYHQPTFSIFLSSLSMQAMIALGRIENPVTKKTEINREQARFLIDTLGIIEKKTKGNLTPDENTVLAEYLFNLRMMYVEAKKND